MGLEKLSGTWLCTEVNNLEGVFEKLEVGWVKRKAAKAFNYGKNRAVQVVTVEGDKITILIKGMYTMTNVFTIGAYGQPALGPDMSSVVCDVVLEGDDVLILNMTSNNNKKIVAKRYIREDGKMVQEFSCEGMTGWRELTKQ
mmetsp:Transcript_36549/g.79643  ORF Transcript_36549/g.79643 Transcript_36549/m.79643 type:complete len:142 (-) Transcript_36549:150-575(-)